MKTVVQLLPKTLPGAVLSCGGKVPKGHKVGGQPPALMNPRVTEVILIDRTGTNYGSFGLVQNFMEVLYNL